MVKLLMSWDIRPGRESEYFEFVVREFAPGIMRLGIQPTEAWYTEYGNGPQILTGGVGCLQGIAARSVVARNRSTIGDFQP